MPYKVIGKTVYHKIGSQWKVKQVAKSHQNALSALRLLSGIESGWKPTRKKTKK